MALVAHDSMPMWTTLLRFGTRSCSWCDAGLAPPCATLPASSPTAKPMAKNEKSSSKVSTIASKALQNPGKVTQKEIKSLAASVLTQAPDKGKKKR